MTDRVIAALLKERRISAEEALESLSDLGASPGLFHDDNGHWAVSFGGFQQVPFGDDPEDLSITCFVEKGYWQKTIREAIIYALEIDEKDEDNNSGE